MANFVLGWPNRFVSGPLSVSAEVTGLGGDNLANDQGSAEQAWQAPSTLAWARISMPNAEPWRGFGLFRTNLTSAAKVRWRVWANSVFDAPLFDSSEVPAGVVPGYHQTVLVLSGDVVGQIMQVDIIDPSNPDGFVNVPLAFAGPVWQPLRNFDASSSAGRVMQQTKTLTRSGGAVIRSDWVKRTFNLSLSGVRAAEVQPKIMDLDLYAKRGNNVLFVPDPAAADRQQTAIFGEMEATSDVTYPNRVIEARGWKATITERL